MTVSSPTQITIPLPSRRTLKKFGRDMLVTVVGSAAVYAGAHYSDLGLSDADYAAIAPVALLAWRLIRQAMGMEPST